jgi:hypothetical protein
VKTLTPNEAIELLPADDYQQGQALARLEDVMSTHDSIENLQAGTSAKEFKAVTISLVEGKPLFVIWYWIDSRSMTLTCAGASITQEHHGELLARGLDVLAAQHKCRWIEFRTKRKGYARAAAHFGYVPDTVNLLKRVE